MTMSSYHFYGDERWCSSKALAGGSSGDDEECDHRLSQDVDGGGGELELVWKGCRRGDDLFGPFYIIYSAQYKTIIGKTAYKKCRALLIPVTEYGQLVGTIKGNLYFSHKGTYIKGSTQMYQSFIHPYEHFCQTLQILLK